MSQKTERLALRHSRSEFEGKNRMRERYARAVPVRLAQIRLRLAPMFRFSAIGVAGFDALNANPEAQSPHGEPGETEQGVSGREGGPVVGTNSFGQSVVFEGVLEDGEERSAETQARTRRAMGGGAVRGGGRTTQTGSQTRSRGRPARSRSHENDRRTGSHAKESGPRH